MASRDTCSYTGGSGEISVPSAKSDKRWQLHRRCAPDIALPYSATVTEATGAAPKASSFVLMLAAVGMLSLHGLLPAGLTRRC
jgi:hypothetical protein